MRISFWVGVELSWEHSTKSFPGLLNMPRCYGTWQKCGRCHGWISMIMSLGLLLAVSSAVSATTGSGAVDIVRMLWDAKIEPNLLNIPLGYSTLQPWREWLFTPRWKVFSQLTHELISPTDSQTRCLVIPLTWTLTSPTFLSCISSRHQVITRHAMQLACHAWLVICCVVSRHLALALQTDRWTVFLMNHVVRCSEGEGGLRAIRFSVVIGVSKWVSLCVEGGRFAYTFFKLASYHAISQYAFSRSFRLVFYKAASEITKYRIEYILFLFTHYHVFIHS